MHPKHSHMIRLLLCAAAVIACTLASAQDISDGLVYHFTFSDRDDPSIDSVTGAQVITGTSDWQPNLDRFGAFPGARTLGQSGVVQGRRATRFAVELHGDYTLSYWLRVWRFFETDKPMYLFDNRTGGQGTGLFARYLPTSNTVEYGEEGALQTASMSLDTVEWVHLAFAEDTAARQRTLYLNGEALPLGGADYRPVTGTASAHPIVRILGSSERQIPRSGAIRYVDDIRLHEGAVTAETVRAMYAARDDVAPEATAGRVTFNTFNNGNTQTWWAEAEDNYAVREYVITLNDSTFVTSTATPFYNYRYDGDQLYTLSIRSVDFFGNVGATTFDTTFTWMSTSAVGEAAWGGELSLAPNPVSAGGTLTLLGLPARPIAAELYAVTGQRIARLGRVNDGVVPLPGVAAGVYLLRLRDENGATVTRRLIAR